MEPNERDDPRAANDSRIRTPDASSKAPVETKPSRRQRWNEAHLSKMATLGLCVASVVVVLILGFTWGGWMTEGGAQNEAEAVANSAVIERLTPICVAQFNQDPDSLLKLDELTGLSTYQQSQYVQDQGWATISGEEKPDRQVASACTQLIMDMSP